MLACLDVNYHETIGVAAAVTFRDWSDASAVDEKVLQLSDIQPYQPGQFFRRELPCLLAVLKTLPPVEIVIVDGYVWLDRASKPGLGGHLYHALKERVAVVGVAKSRFHGADAASEVTRGESRRPLFVTAAGMQAELAAEFVRSMHGKYRIPTLLARADYLCRHE
jgi:deoxyribonuclease V